MPVRHNPATHSGTEPIQIAPSVTVGAKIVSTLESNIVFLRPSASKMAPHRMRPNPLQTDSTHTSVVASAAEAPTERAKSFAKLMTVFPTAAMAIVNRKNRQKLGR